MPKLIGEILVEMESCTQEAIQEALNRQMAGDKRRIGVILVGDHACTEEDVARALADQSDLRYYDLESIEIPPQVVHLVPGELARDKRCLPVQLQGKTLTVALADPMDLEAVDTLRFTTSLAIEVAVASERQIRAAIERFHGLSQEKVDAMLGEFTQQLETRKAGEGGPDDGEDAAIVKFVQNIIAEGVKRRASDIHVEPMLDHLRIRYRIDGICLAVDPTPKRLQGAILQRIKIMAGVQIEEKRRPQDGRIKIKLGEKKIDLRVSVLPANYGESIVMRILDSESLRLSLDDMGFDATDLKVYNSILRRPNGIVLVTGPTGSGKTTTLYATLFTLNSVDRKIITAEDPVEYHLSGINQCQVQHKIGLDFPRILRAMLRQAPNVILVGEIRDAETARIAINASLTGHLVFSTLHTNDAPSAITRLIDMGVEPFLVSTSIQAVVAQRLLRINCPKCIEPYEPDAKMLIALGVRPELIATKPFRRGRGCDNCAGTGYRGRRGLFEVMVMNQQIRELAFNKAPFMEVRRAAIANGMTSLAQDGVRKALQGLTTIEEVLRTAKADD
ncbi:type IV fimbrial assembly protein PilB [Planctomycetota bacterium]|nr:type IV fimbrial assembly protein PilB [Planctomycetota bacterium]